MSAKRLAYAVGVATMAASAAYFFVYLYRWEWNRAMISGVIFVASEVAVIGAVVLGRLQRLAAPAPPKGSEQVLATLRQAAPAPRDHFAWLAPTDRLGVFVPILMGAGVVMSALAWAVERIARRSAGPALERGLAARLAAFSLPEGGLLAPAVDELAILRAPMARRAP